MGGVLWLFFGAFSEQKRGFVFGNVLGVQVLLSGEPSL